MGRRMAFHCTALGKPPSLTYADNHKYAADAIEPVVKKLKEEGYEFVTVSELLELKELREN